VVGKESEFTWNVSVKDIAANNYNLDIKNPNTVDEDRGDPKELLKKYLQITKEIEKTRNALKKELMESLGETK
jgi:type I restriction enzyme M protein